MEKTALELTNAELHAIRETVLSVFLYFDYERPLDKTLTVEELNLAAKALGIERTPLTAL